MSIHFMLHSTSTSFPSPDLNLCTETLICDVELCQALSGGNSHPMLFPMRLLGFAFQKFQGKPEPGASCSPSNQPSPLWGGSSSDRWLSTGAAWECGIYSQNSQGFLGGRRWWPYLTEGGRDGSDPALNLKHNNGSRGWGRVRSCFQTQTCQKYRFSALPLGNSFISQLPSPSVHPVPPSLQFPEETQRYRFHPGCMGGL